MSAQLSGACERALAVNEILHSILEALTDEPGCDDVAVAAATLFPVALVCRSWNAVATPLLYKRIELGVKVEASQIRREAQLLVTLCSERGVKLCKFVRAIVWTVHVRCGPRASS